ncbi:hypothetical protein [Antrihabitans cavernicola]|uniref:Uncharacterized protein n=1 Tax=Antrihabitans cavernicola TaxID=2495913 RepID=A0A5A7SJ53_9NOCA|nr:hypothetical protein [Spelaeibacter cavernicola]KAA0024653.1 hypothetical protein FOY51_01535 [Spelaeibacter cavernicola]
MNLDDLIGSLTRSIQPTQAYRNASAAERRNGALALQMLLADDPEAATPLAAVGLTVSDVMDSTSGRRCTVAIGERGTERAWGMVIVDRGAAPRVQIEVPHPKADQGTELIGLQSLRAIPGSVLIVAGAHRRAAGLADVAHDDRSLFHAMATASADLFELQLHGFADDSSAGCDVVISAGPGTPGEIHERLADQLTADLKVRRAWRRPEGRLEGNQNSQATAAAQRNRGFCHLELNATTRATRSDVVVAALAATFDRK